MKFYLAHPLLAKEKIRKWQDSIELKTGILFLNPFFHPESGEDECKEELKKKKLPYEKIVKDLVEADLRLISKSDGVVAVVDGNFSYGTIQEMVYAKLFRKPLFIVITNGEEKHPWFVYHADKIFTNFKDLEEHLMKLHRSSKIEKFF